MQIEIVTPMLVNELKKSFLVSLWFMFLTFPIMVIRVNTVENIIQWRWANLFFVGIGSFALSALWRYLIRRKEQGLHRTEVDGVARVTLSQRLLSERRFTIPALIVVGIGALAFPFVFSIYQTNIMITALIYVMLGLGLNIVVGVAGLLDLGYVAFYAVGAYSYALLNYHFGLGFWTVLGIGGGMAAMFGIILGFPVLRLRGDYLAIVTLGFGEIIRLILENWNAFSFGPSGIANIPRPGLFGIDLNIEQATIYVYFLMIAMSLLPSLWSTGCRIRGSEGPGSPFAKMKSPARPWASTSVKPSSWLLPWAPPGPVSPVWSLPPKPLYQPGQLHHLGIHQRPVCGGTGWDGIDRGGYVGAFILILLPEYLRFLSEYRMLAFGTVLVMMMVFRPGGIVETVRRTYQYKVADQ
jgi:branched-chain amino acid transport system permease protein